MFLSLLECETEVANCLYFMSQLLRQYFHKMKLGDLGYNVSFT